MRCGRPARRGSRGRARARGCSSPAWPTSAWRSGSAGWGAVSDVRLRTGVDGILPRMGGARAIALVTAALLIAPAGASADAWYPGELHVHTCYSHDAYCGPTDDNTDPDVIYSSGGTVRQRFLESSGKGLAFLAITDH